MTTPNEYKLKGENYSIGYMIGPIPNKKFLKCSHHNMVQNFEGPEIHEEKAEIGTLITVTLEQVPDLSRTTLTVLIPTINLDKPEAAFKTTAIITTHHTSIGGPNMVTGAVQTYKLEELEGIATVIRSFVTTA